MGEDKAKTLVQPWAFDAGYLQSIDSWDMLKNQQLTFRDNPNYLLDSEVG